MYNLYTPDNKSGILTLAFFISSRVTIIKNEFLVSDTNDYKSLINEYHIAFPDYAWKEKHKQISRDYIL